MNEAVLEVSSLHKSFPVRQSLGSKLRRDPRQAVTAVDGVSITVARGQVFGIVGESGCGKTTLARCITRLMEPDSGSVLLQGTDLLSLDSKSLRSARRRIQMVFQDPYTSLNPRLTIGEAVGEAVRVHGIVDRDQEATYVREMLETVGLAPRLADQYPKGLSGGQRQRAAIARALALKPDVLIADEAVSALDVSIQAQILNLIRSLTSELGLATVFIAHQLAVISNITDEVAVMYLGQVVEQGATSTVFGDPQHPYTKALLASHPDPDIRDRPEEPGITGDVPSPLAIPEGCRFATRCPYANETCAVEPQLVDVAPGHGVRCGVLPFR